MAAIAALEHISLARNLPIRLQRFFAVNPPRPLAAAASLSTPDDTIAHAADIKGSDTQLNPFQPHKNPRTGRWHPPIYSLRRQAELVKLARNHGVEELLPHSQKLTEERQRRRDEHSARIQGVGAGRKPKGHKWERSLKGRLDKRRKAMLDMPQMIQEWKQVGSAC